MFPVVQFRSPVIQVSCASVQVLCIHVQHPGISPVCGRYDELGHPTMLLERVCNELSTARYCEELNSVLFSTEQYFARYFEVPNDVRGCSSNGALLGGELNSLPVLSESCVLTKIVAPSMAVERTDFFGSMKVLSPVSQIGASSVNLGVDDIHNACVDVLVKLIEPQALVFHVGNNSGRDVRKHLDWLHVSSDSEFVSSFESSGTDDPGNPFALLCDKPFVYGASRGLCIGWSGCFGGEGGYFDLLLLDAFAYIRALHLFFVWPGNDVVGARLSYGYPVATFGVDLGAISSSNWMVRA
ncbi:hypothetical protein MA16_Dca025197 [Dendrobium catenatum]|uniref:Uncharacterized protein n=1 Tax=Dendrobium catenatum TaxID=906689 RepID=A0A2I0XER7_9ASPA|nr:hypothetical protein MA16_Dca025197 [Dendrobium catenatum]